MADAGKNRPHSERRLVDLIHAEATRATGRRYRIDLDALDADSLRELLRLVRDLEQEQHAAEERARTLWRRGLRP